MAAFQRVPSGTTIGVLAASVLRKAVRMVRRGENKTVRDFKLVIHQPAILSYRNEAGQTFSVEALVVNTLEIGAVWIDGEPATAEAVFKMLPSFTERERHEIMNAAADSAAAVLRASLDTVRRKD